MAALAAQPLGEVRALAREHSLPLCFGRMTPVEAGRMMESIQHATTMSSDSSAQLRAAPWSDP